MKEIVERKKERETEKRESQKEKLVERQKWI
jgi:hypothetical protein